MQQSTGTRKKIILVGHPNVGKSAVFFRITGKYVSVSNYPGTTVDIFTGHATVNGHDYEVLDTPGINKLFASSEEEQVTLNLLRKEKPDLIVQVADGKNLRRTLLLTAQLARLKLPMVLDLNMTDERNGKGIRLDCQRLADRLEIPVVETTAITGEGVEQVLSHLDSEALCSMGGLQPFEWVEEILLEVRHQGAVTGDSFTSSWTRLLTIALATGTLLHFESYFGPLLGWLTIHGLLTNLLQKIGSPETLTSIVAVFGGFLLPVLLPFPKNPPITTRSKLSPNSF